MAKKKKIEETTPIENAVEVNEEMDDINEVPEDEMSIEELNKAEQEARLARMVYNEELGFSVIKKLNSDEIESIANFASDYISWADRYYAKAIITLNVATSLEKEEIDNLISNIDFVEYPFINTVYNSIDNWYMVEEAINYYTSISYKFTTFISMLGNVAENGDLSEASMKDIMDFARKGNGEDA